MTRLLVWLALGAACVTAATASYNALASGPAVRCTALGGVHLRVSLGDARWTECAR